MIRLYQGSILDVEAHALVNPANSHLRHGGGLARIIANAARDYGKTHVPVTQPHGLHTESEETRIRALAAMWDEEQEAHPLIATGNAGITTPGALPHKCIVHAVGPVWNGGDFCEAVLLAKAHTSAIERARELGCESIAFPAISCGIFGYPVERAAIVAVASLVVASANMDITIALFEDAHVEAYGRALDLILGKDAER